MSTDIAYLEGKPLFFSDDTPAALAHLLMQADRAPTPEERGRLLQRAVAEWSDGLDAHIALYKFHFRSGRYREAERAVWATLKEAARQGGFTRNYRRLTPQSADWLGDTSVSRLYLFSLKALGVVRLRRGRVTEAERVLAKLLELDPQDEIGGGNFLNIARGFHTSD